MFEKIRLAYYTCRKRMSGKQILELDRRLGLIEKDKKTEWDVYFYNQLTSISEQLAGEYRHFMEKESSLKAKLTA